MKQTMVGRTAKKWRNKTNKLNTYWLDENYKWHAYEYTSMGEINEAISQGHLSSTFKFHSF